MGAAGAGGVPTVQYVEEAFQVDLYEGTSSTKSIPNGLDLAADGGMVWIKNWYDSREHIITDTERGPTKQLFTDSGDAEATNTARITSFNSDGYTLGSDNKVNQDERGHLAYTFKRAKGFFDVVTWAGNGASSRTIPHLLGTNPGSIWIKNRDDGYDWRIYFADGSNGGYYWFILNSTTGQGNNSGSKWIDADADEFTLNNAYNNLNVSGENYVAYIFGNGDNDYGTNKNESIIKVGKYNGNAGTLDVNLGWEPQWLLIKSTQSSTDWILIDAKNGASNYKWPAMSIKPNTTSGRSQSQGRVVFTTTGFTLYQTTQWEVNKNNVFFYYIAIRADHKVPTSGAEIANHLLFTGNGQARTIALPSSGIFDSDAIMLKVMNNGSNSNQHHYWTTRELGSDNASNYHELYTAANTSTSRYAQSDFIRTYGSDSKITIGNSSYINPGGGEQVILNCFKKAPGFMDLIHWRGNGSSQNIAHGLGVVPKWVIIKSFTSSENWVVYSHDLGSSLYMELNDSNTPNSSSTMWNSTVATSSQFTVGQNNAVNASNQYYMAYLFADCANVCKTVFYTGNNVNNRFLNFGFRPRYVIIRNTTNSGNWYQWDSALGITTSANFCKQLNSNDHNNAGGVSTSSTGMYLGSSLTSDINASANNYLALAIA